MKVLYAMLLVGALAVLALELPTKAQPNSLAELSTSIRAEFPDVSSITTKELADWLSDANRTPPLLLDAREEKEYAVSHLSGARRAESDASAQLRGVGAKSDTPVVVYCSVGYRSARLAEALRKQGFLNIRNLEGSIFAWANEGRPLVNANGPANGVHPYNDLWGRYLDKSKWQWTPPAATKPR